VSPSPQLPSGRLPLLTLDEAKAAAAGARHDGFGAAERAVLAATDEVLETGVIDPGTWQACTEHVSDDPQVLLEVVAVIGLWRMVSTLLRSIDVPLEDGVLAWPPDGVVPAVGPRSGP
jgi:alkylhydroperoxidase family enzyme